MPSIETYYQCTKCNHIEKDKNWNRVETNSYKCNECDAIEEKRVWPPKEVETMVNFILSYDSETSEYGQITSVFLSSVLELLLEELLYTMAYLDLTYHDAWILVDALIDAHRGRNRMISLYKKIGYGTFYSSVKKLGFTDFYRNWDEIVKVRNKVVHGKLEYGKKINSQMVNSTITYSLELFSKLHNIYNRETLEYKYSAKRKGGINADLKKLDKWSQGLNQDSLDNHIEENDHDNE